MENNEFSSNSDILAGMATEYKKLDGSMIYAHLSTDMPGGSAGILPNGMKVEGSVFMLLAKGNIDLTYNFKNYHIEAPAAISFPHGTILSFESRDYTSIDAYLLCYTPGFLQDVNISFRSISGEALIDRDTPVLALEDAELRLLLRYFSLMREVLDDTFNVQLSKHILSSLTSSLFYQLMAVLYKRIDITAPDTMGPRRGSYVHDFIKLVHIYYTRERSVSFYASKLFISPKYLSLLVKEATGRSAARWIDHFVIMEAKNLLRYSGKNIQQVAYDLNFSNQSSFGKYFKHLTGMSPTEFQKS